MLKHQEQLVQYILILLMYILALVISIYLVMIIWNKVLIKKFPTSNIQELTFWEALALCILTGLLFGGGHSVVVMKTKDLTVG